MPRIGESATVSPPWCSPNSGDRVTVGTFANFRIAIDVDAALNAAHTSKPGEYPEPWGPAWVERWPRGLPQGFVEAFEAAGWTWGGRWREYCDPMHFSWDRRP